MARSDAFGAGLRAPIDRDALGSHPHSAATSSLRGRTAFRPYRGRGLAGARRLPGRGGARRHRLGVLRRARGGARASDPVQEAAPWLQASMSHSRTALVLADLAGLPKSRHTEGKTNSLRTVAVKR